MTTRFLLVLFCVFVYASNSNSKSKCKCKSEDLCKALTTTPQLEVFGFAPDERSSAWYSQYDWDILTTVAWKTDPEFVCYAHERGVRAVYLAEGYTTQKMKNQTWRKEWIEQQVQYTLDNYLDGINFDAEGPSFSNDPFTKLYTQLVTETAEAFHKTIPGSQISVDIPWSPYGVDNRYYDWVGLAEAADILFIMAYDMASQIWGRCVASANSPIALVNKGLQQFIIELGISPQKLVLGLPWYGYMYPCFDGNVARSTKITEVCQLGKADFRGAPCSDAAGFQKPFLDIFKNYLYNGSGVNLQYDNIQQAPYFNIQNENGEVSQFWYDDIQSLKPKYDLVNQWGMKGVGVWNLDLLDHNPDNKEAFAMTKEMWKTMKNSLYPPPQICSS